MAENNEDRSFSSGDRNPNRSDRPKGKGKRKMEIKKIANEKARQVCFSKRRQGLFKKASELVTLCGGDIAIVVFTPAGNTFTYSNSSIDNVLDRYVCSDGHQQNKAKKRHLMCSEEHSHAPDFTSDDLAAIARKMWSGSSTIFEDRAKSSCFGDRDTIHDSSILTPNCTFHDIIAVSSSNQVPNGSSSWSDDYFASSDLRCMNAETSYCNLQGGYNYDIDGYNIELDPLTSTPGCILHDFGAVSNPHPFPYGSSGVDHSGLGSMNGKTNSLEDDYHFDYHIDPFLPF